MVINNTPLLRSPLGGWVGRKKEDRIRGVIYETDMRLG